MNGRILFALVLVGFAAHAQEQLREATPKEVAAIKADLETKLKDASSAKFQNVRVKGDHFCGLVNSKNSYGAYAGYTPIGGMLFKIEGKQAAAVIGLDSPEATRSVCQIQGIPLPPG